MHISIKSSRSDSQTLSQEYYDLYAEEYAYSTLDVDVTRLYQKFLEYLPPNGRILDAGSGSGRDTLAFLARGYEVEAFDSSRSLCELSTQLTGVKTKLLRFQDFKDVEQYDGIWACASLLHVPEAELPDAVSRLLRSLKHGGALYMSFKHGVGERVSSDGRFYTDMNASHLETLFKSIPGVQIAESWISQGEGDFKGQAEWLNAIALKECEREAHG